LSLGCASLTSQKYLGADDIRLTVGHFITALPDFQFRRTRVARERGIVMSSSGGRSREKCDLKRHPGVRLTVGHFITALPDFQFRRTRVARERGIVMSNRAAVARARSAT